MPGAKARSDWQRLLGPTPVICFPSAEGTPASAPVSRNPQSLLSLHGQPSPDTTAGTVDILPWQETAKEVTPPCLVWWKSLSCTQGGARTWKTSLPLYPGPGRAAGQRTGSGVNVYILRNACSLAPESKASTPRGFPQRLGVCQATLWTVGPKLVSTQHGRNLSPSSFQIPGSGTHP